MFAPERKFLRKAPAEESCLNLTPPNPTASQNRKRTAGGLFLVLVSIGMASAVLLGLLGLMANSRQKANTRSMLAELRSTVFEIAKLEWSCLNIPQTASPQASQVNELSKQAERQTQEIIAQGMGAPQFERLQSLKSDYLNGVDLELSLLEEGNPRAALRQQSQATEPKFRALVAQIDREIGHAQSAEEQSQSLAVWGSACLLIVAGLALGLLFIRFIGADRRQTRNEAKEEFESATERRLSLLLNHASDAILVANCHGKVIYSTDSFARIASIGESVYEVVHPEDAPDFNVAFAKAEEGAATVDVEVRVRGRDCKYRPHALTLVNHLDVPSIRGIQITYRNISERRAFEEAMSHRDLHDALTGLPNRALFLSRLEHSLGRNRRAGSLLAVLVLDIDNFKVINDGLGHASGDKVLIEAGNRIVSTIRQGDTIARFGGDEFTVLLENVQTPADAYRIAQRILAAFTPVFVIEDRSVFVGCSLGIALSTRSKDDSATLLRDADAAMSNAKLNGKSRIVLFQNSMQEHALERLELENDLRQAIELDHLDLQYQPIVDLKSQNIVEMEALARWTHPTRGALPPMKFIPIAEESGLIVPLGEWVLRHACTQAVQWIEEGIAAPDLIVCVNVSSRQLAQPNFTHLVAGILKETALPAQNLKLEITESTMVLDSESTIAQLYGLSDLGIKIAVDDFGTGYSTMSYLNSLPVNTLKVDASFVSRLGGEGQAEAIVQAIIALAQSLNLEVTSEGIETELQADWLRERGSDLGQGFLFSRPLNINEAKLALLKARKGNQAEAA